MGRTTDPWRTAQARDRYRADERGQVPGTEETPPSQGWSTFLRNHADGIAAMDLFVAPTISFRLLYGLLILRHDRRTHLSLDQDAPIPRAVEAIGRILSRPVLGGLHHKYVRT
jgi:hypothetical protein